MLWKWRGKTDLQFSSVELQDEDSMCENERIFINAVLKRKEENKKAFFGLWRKNSILLLEVFCAWNWIL